MSPIARLQAVAERHRFIIAMVVVIGIACLMTAISLSLYGSSGTLQLDLSRPGYASVRKEIVNPDDISTFSPNGPINSEVLDQYQKLFDSQRKEMNSIGRFKDKGLDDTTLGLTAPDTTPTPEQ